MDACFLTVDVFTNKFYSLAEKQLLSLGGGYDDVTERLGGGGDDCIEIMGSSHGWIVLWSIHKEEVYLWNPVSRRRINLPPINTLPTLENIQEGGCCPVAIAKVILSSSNPDDAHCRVVVLYGPGERLAFCCPGQSRPDWISIGSWWWLYTNDRRLPRVYVDMAYSRKQNRLLCITDDHYELERWDLEDPLSPTMDGDKDVILEDVILQYAEFKRGEGRSTYLVISEDDELFVVVRMSYRGRKWMDNTNDPHKTTGFVIFRGVRGEDGMIITVHPVVNGDTGGLAMFVGLNHAFALSAIQFSDLKPNSIYFTSVSVPEKSRWYRSVCCLTQYDIGIFDCQSRKFYPCYCPQQHDHVSDNGEEDNDGSEEEDNDYDGSKQESSEDEDSYSRPYDEEKDGDLPKFVWFRPSSQL